jgi:hypothetical protein
MVEYANLIGFQILRRKRALGLVPVLDENDHTLITQSCVEWAQAWAKAQAQLFSAVPPVFVELSNRNGLESFELRADTPAHELTTSEQR